VGTNGLHEARDGAAWTIEPPRTTATDRLESELHLRNVLGRNLDEADELLAVKAATEPAPNELDTSRVTLDDSCVSLLFHLVMDGARPFGGVDIGDGNDLPATERSVFSFYVEVEMDGTPN